MEFIRKRGRGEGSRQTDSLGLQVHRAPDGSLGFTEPQRPPRAAPSPDALAALAGTWRAAPPLWLCRLELLLLGLLLGLLLLAAMLPLLLMLLLVSAASDAAC